jgi:ankyrin repeat protein
MELIKLVIFNKRKKVEKLLKEKPHIINDCCPTGGSALYYACWQGNTDIAKLLIDSGIDVDLEDKHGRDAHFMSVRESTKRLIEQQREKNAKNT